ncbi:MAG TPA: M23 family metallopeptidase [Paenisporosarcina sp.]|nr:M23 family metallopeptidase [Paenisporosarcina sp.]
MNRTKHKIANAEVDNSTENLIETLLDGNVSLNEQKVTSKPQDTQTYQLPVQVGRAGQPLSEGDRPWIVGHFSPGVATDINHPKGHNGMDLKATCGTPVYPIGPGVVKEVGVGPISGNFVKCLHEDGNVQSFYGHLNSTEVQRGQEVTKTTIIGRVGDSGNAKNRGCHVHLEVKVNNSLINPMSILGKLIGSLSKKASLFSYIIREAAIYYAACQDFPKK